MYVIIVSAGEIGMPLTDLRLALATTLSSSNETTAGPTILTE